MSFFHQMKVSLVGAFFGVLLIPGSICLHAWNEYRTIHRSRGLNEAADLVVSIPDPNLIDDQLQDKFVHLSGFADTQEYLRDELFGVGSRAIHLARRVEMFQWVEDEREDSEGNKRYSYSKRWHRDRVDSRAFRKSGYDNPPLKFASKQLTAEQVAIGAYELNKTLKRSVNNWEEIRINQAAIFEMLGPGSQSQFTVDENRLYWAPESPQPDAPELGDLRIRFLHVEPTDVSLVAKQAGSSFDEFTTSNGETIQRLYLGTLNAAEVMQKLITENIITAWLIRLGGLVMCVVGFSVILKPIASLVRWIPFLGDVAGFALFLVGALCATVVSLTTISIAWLAVRPLLSLALVAIASLLGYLIYRLTKSTQEEPPAINV